MNSEELNEIVILATSLVVAMWNEDVEAFDHLWEDCSDRERRFIAIALAEYKVHDLRRMAKERNIAPKTVIESWAQALIMKQKPL